MRLPLLLALLALPASANPPAYQDPEPQRYQFSARASQIDPRAREHPEINFLFQKDGKPQDTQHATVDTRVEPRGELVIWLMGHNGGLFERVASYGQHAIQVHYANGWFGKLYSGAPPEDDLFLSKIRLEAATGQDHSQAVTIPEADGLMERSHQFVRWLIKENPQGKWDQFLAADGKGLDWDKVVLAGISHGSTTAARFAKHQRVARVVMLSGPRDQFEVWQKLPSATPPERYFGFTHILDGGWTADHYCRSWLLLGLQQFGPLVNIDDTTPPYGNSRRLISNADVENKPDRAHNAPVPGNQSPKNAEGKFLYEDVWRYLFTHPVDQVGQPATPEGEDCKINQR
jgi:hypothetical protein